MWLISRRIWTPTTPPPLEFHSPPSPPSPHLTQPNLHNHNIRHSQREKHHQWILMTQRCGWAHQCYVKTLSGMKWRKVDYTQHLSAASQISFALMHFNKTRTRGCWAKLREPLISSSCVFFFPLGVYSDFLVISCTLVTFKFTEMSRRFFPNAVVILKMWLKTND